jgi:hypothetical protein
MAIEFPPAPLLKDTYPIIHLAQFIGPKESKPTTRVGKAIQFAREFFGIKSAAQRFQESIISQSLRKAISPTYTENFPFLDDISPEELEIVNLGTAGYINVFSHQRGDVQYERSYNLVTSCQDNIYHLTVKDLGLLPAIRRWEMIRGSHQRYLVVIS